MIHIHQLKDNSMGKERFSTQNLNQVQYTTALEDELIPNFLHAQRFQWLTQSGIYLQITSDGGKKVT